MSGYLRSPALSAEHLAFVCEDALWVSERDGGVARRLTAEDQSVQAPCFSPDGRHIAFSSDHEGFGQVYVVPTLGGVPRQITHEAEPCVPVAFRRNGRCVFRSSREAHIRRFTSLFEVDLSGAGLERLPVGRAVHASFADDDDTVAVGRNTFENAWWKRYRGGMAGDVWIGSLAKRDFRRLVVMDGGPIRPVFAGGRVCFLSDEDGIGNVWSCLPDGSDLRQDTHSGEFYSRFLSAFGDELVFTRAGEIHRLDLRTGAETPVAVTTGSTGVQLQRKFVPPSECMQELDLSRDGRRIVGAFRGKALAMDCWGAGARWFGARSGVRYRLPRWLGGEPKATSAEVVLVSDEGGEEGLETYAYETGERTRRAAFDGVRRAWDLFPNPTRSAVAVTDVSGKLQLYDFEGPPVTIAESDGGPLLGAAWSPDGRWLAYVFNLREIVGVEGGVLYLFDSESGTSTRVSAHDLPVFSPAFDPDGRLLYVLSARTFNPVIDTAMFGASCPQPVRVYAYVLKDTGLSPFDPRWVDVVEEEEKQHKKDTKDDDDEDAAPRLVAIDLDGLVERMVEFPDVPAGLYSDLQAAKGCVLFEAHPLVGLLDTDHWVGDSEDILPELVHFELKTGKRTTILEKIEGFQVQGGNTLVRSKKGVHVLKTGEAPPEEPPREGMNRGTGLVDLDRMRVEVVPGEEWRQMYVEAWRMQREHFWSPDMAQVDWKAMRDRYLPLLARVATRAELSDVIWEMQGELGTSHAYEMFGDYPDRRSYPVGLLGADLAWDGEAYRIERVFDGDAWRPEASSPLADPGAQVTAGDRVLAIDGLPVDDRNTPRALLANRADRHVELTIAPKEGGGERRVVVRTLAAELPLRYRDWVKRNHARVLARSDGRLGYLHIPDMGGAGLAEFFRAFRVECQRGGLVVDVRNNGGGFVSQIILDCLRREVIQFERPRYGRYYTYPMEAVRGPQVALCDQFAGSDGDIFCHGFKVYGLGPLIGKRTWGGVVGIDVNGYLADETIVTQPEYAFYSKQLGWSIENRGVEPDIEVEFDPAAMVAGEDPQLEKAIDVALELLAESPVEDPKWAPVPPRA